MIAPMAKVPVTIKPAKTAKTPAGRQTKYTRTVHNRIIKEIKRGASIRDAGLLAGLGRDTLDTWLYNARKNPEMYPQFVQLMQDMDAARAESRVERVERIEQAGKSGTWQADAWYLERTDPENWGRKDKVEVKQDSAPAVQMNLVVLHDPEVRAASRELLRRVAGPRPVGAELALRPSDSVHVEDGDEIIDGESVEMDPR